MSEGLEKLRSIGAQKIHEQTHISQRYVQALLHESFEGMQKVQLFGFISILEREYDVDLESLRERANEYFDTLKEEKGRETPEYKKELFAKSNDEKKRLYLITALFVVLVVAVMLYFGLRQDDKAMPESAATTTHGQTSQDEASLPDERGMNVRYIKEDENNESNASVEDNATHAESSLPDESGSAKKIEQEKKPQIFTIVPRTKVWVGIIDLTSGKKRQTISAKPIELNASKDYLLTFGHGYIDMKIDENTTSYKEPKHIKFLYQEGKLKRIGPKEFKRYNKGKLW